MSRVRSNFRVELEPDTWRGQKPEVICHSIAAAIKRHIDDVANITIQWDMVCSFCNSPWEEARADEPECGVKKGQPLCCDGAIEEWDKEQVAKGATP